MFSLTFTLRQHTPIIHFQHEQEGATLRATEVKPKLDRFIIEKMGGTDIAKQLHPDWFKSDKPALDYKLTIRAEGEPKKYIITSRLANGEPSQQQVLERQGYNCLAISPYFAQEKEIGELFNKNNRSFSAKPDFDQRISALNTIGLLHNTDIKLIIQTNHFALRKFLETEIKRFFISENFGTRQSKGFGIFLVKNTSDSEIESSLIENNSITGIFKLSNNSSIARKFEFITEKYSLLKRGQGEIRNMRGDIINTYQKSKLWEFYCKNGSIGWEKKKIKIFLKTNHSNVFNGLASYNNSKRMDSCNTDTSDYQYIRALLGLSEQYEFKQASNNKLKVLIKDNLKNLPDINGEPNPLKKEAVDRFKSPIRFLLTDTAIFLVTYPIPRDLSKYLDATNKEMDREFNFKCEGIATNNSFNLTIPDNFDLPSFLSSTNLFGKNLKS